MTSKYIGRVVEIVYMDQAGKLSQRRIEVHGMKDGLIRATCQYTGEPRTFREDNVLAWQPVTHTA